MKSPTPSIRKLLKDPQTLTIYVIPALLFVLDFVLRAALGADLTAVGADMALLAVMPFLAFLGESFHYQRGYAYVPVLFSMIFLIPWVICIKLTLLQDSVPLPFLNLIDTRLALSWSIGLVALILSAIIAHTIVVRLIKPIPE
jgi:hypothetical protein